MVSSQIDNLKLTNVTEDILLVHQIKPPFRFSCCDGLLILPKRGRNSNTIALDVNIEPHLINKLNEKYGPTLDYVCTHGHMDHIAHVHQWEKLGAIIHAPYPESSYLLKLRNFYEGFGFNEKIRYPQIEKFGEVNGFKTCSNIEAFKPGKLLEFENLVIQTIPLTGHSKSHIGLFLPENKIFHVSCLGFDQPSPQVDGFGPWYGFRDCSIEQYLRDITVSENFYIEKSKFLTSSHSYIVKHPDLHPFEYMRAKIKLNQQKVEEKLELVPNLTTTEELTEKLLDLDIFFPKQKMNDFLLEIYNLWEYWIIRKHIERKNMKIGNLN